MLIKHQGYPEEDDLVLCTVTGINPHSVFCRLDEYDNRSGMIHISEIAPGRIRNIKEHVSMGKKLVCKVLRINEERGHIDLSIRRVNESQKRNKLSEIKQEQLAEKIVEFVAKDLKKDTMKLYSTLHEKLSDYGGLFSAFEEVTHDALDLSEYVDKKTADALTDAIKARIKPPEVQLTGNITMTCYASDGVKRIKKALSHATKAEANVFYLGAGTFHVSVKAEDYKEAEKLLKNALDPTLKYAEKHDIKAEWVRTED